MKKQTKCRLYTRVSTAMQVDGYEETEALKRDWEKITVYAPERFSLGTDRKGYCADIPSPAED